MCIKLLGIGVNEYAVDSFNLFDYSVVMISLIENIIDWIGVYFGGGRTISALRAIKLLGVFKLARSWTSFKNYSKRFSLRSKISRTFQF